MFAVLFRAINQTKSLIVVLSNHLLNYPTPNNLNYVWSLGSLVGIVFFLQIITGIFLAMHYTPHVDLAFPSVEHIMTDVKYGWIFRYLHANGASTIFILMYTHMGRGFYFQSFIQRPWLWVSGVVIFLLMMATAFIGYVLPWGQMSYWGATVITSLVTAVPDIGGHIAYWVWGGFSINNATLTRFFSLHYLLPFIIISIILLHLVVLHGNGSTNPSTVSLSRIKIAFHPYFSYKDLFSLTATLIIFSLFVYFSPNLLGHSDNFLGADPLVTPAHIVPEWYFTPFYAILRSCPDKLGGAVGMLAAILILVVLPLYTSNFFRQLFNVILIPVSPSHKLFFWFYAGNFFVLMYLGSNPASAPFIIASKLFTSLYFFSILLVLPMLLFASKTKST